MKRLFLPLLMVILCVGLSYAIAEGSATEDAVFKLPASLRVIEESAFENTKPTLVFFPDSLESIGEKAFAGQPGLMQVYIPGSVTHIGKGAFSGRDGLVIFGESGSYAEGWAKDNGYRFVYVDVWVENETKYDWFVRREITLLPYSLPQQDNIARLILFICFFFAILLVNPKKRSVYYPINYDFP